MKDQCDKLGELGVAARPAEQRARAPPRSPRPSRRSPKAAARIVFTTPERLADPTSSTALVGASGQPARGRRGALRLAVGTRLPPGLPRDRLGDRTRSAIRTILALTATATAGGDRRHRAAARRRSLRGRQHRPLPAQPALPRRAGDQRGRQARSAPSHSSATREGSGIVYAATVKAVEAVLRRAGARPASRVARYHGRLGAAERRASQDAFMGGAARA